MERRTFLKLGAAIAGAVALPLSMGNKVDPGCSANNSQQDSGKKGAKHKKLSTHHRGRKVGPGKPDDGKRYRCTHPSHKRPYIIFGSAGVTLHIRYYPSHRGYIVRYA